MKRDVPDYDSKPHIPENPKSWYKAYKKLKKEASEASSNAELILKATLSGIKSAKEQNTAEVVSTAKGNALYSSTAPPGPSRRVQMRYDYDSGRTGSKGSHKISLMEKIRKEARGSGTGVMSRPMHELQKKHNGVNKAPAQFVEDVKRMKMMQQMDAKKALIPPPRRPMSISKPPMHGPESQPERGRHQPAATAGVQPYDLTTDREARLRALKSGQPMPPRAHAPRATPSQIPDSALSTGQPRPAIPPRRMSDSDGNVNTLTLDFLESDSSDDLFDERPIKTPSKKRQREEDDELFGTKRPTPPTKRNRNEEDDSGLPQKTLRPARNRTIVSDDDEDVSPPKLSKPSVEQRSETVRKLPKPLSDEDISPPPKISRPTAEQRGEQARKMLKPLGDDDRARSRSPLKLSQSQSPASSPKVGPVKKRAAPNLFMKRR